DAIAAGLNPLEPAGDADGNRFPLQTHADLVRALFIASFRAEEPFPQVLSAALTRVYEEAGWDLALGEPRRAAAAYPVLAELPRAPGRGVTEIRYRQRITHHAARVMPGWRAPRRPLPTRTLPAGGDPRL